MAQTRTQNDVRFFAPQQLSVYSIASLATTSLKNLLELARVQPKKEPQPKLGPRNGIR